MKIYGPMFGVGVAFAVLGFGQLAVAEPAGGQQAGAAPLTRAQLDELHTRLQRHIRQERGRLAALQRQVDVATLFFRLGEVAYVDEVRFFGPPVGDEDEPRPITALVFVPKRSDGQEHGSLLIWQRGDDEREIESWSDVPELSELVGRGVTVIAPAYEGAPEERLDAVRDYAVQRYPFLQADRVQWREPG